MLNIIMLKVCFHRPCRIFFLESVMGFVLFHVLDVCMMKVLFGTKFGTIWMQVNFFNMPTHLIASSHRGKYRCRTHNLRWNGYI